MDEFIKQSGSQLVDKIDVIHTVLWEKLIEKNIIFAGDATHIKVNTAIMTLSVTLDILILTLRLLS